jgi:hypothetical protein
VTARPVATPAWLRAESIEALRIVEQRTSLSDTAHHAAHTALRLVGICRAGHGDRPTAGIARYLSHCWDRQVLVSRTDQARRTLTPAPMLRRLASSGMSCSQDEHHFEPKPLQPFWPVIADTPVTLRALRADIPTGFGSGSTFCLGEGSLEAHFGRRTVRCRNRGLRG